MCKCAEGVVVVHGVEPERAQQEQHELVLGHGVVSVVPHEGDSPEQGKREKGARGGGVLTLGQIGDEQQQIDDERAGAGG